MEEKAMKQIAKQAGQHSILLVPAGVKTMLGRLARLQDDTM